MAGRGPLVGALALVLAACTSSPTGSASGSPSTTNGGSGSPTQAAAVATPTPQPTEPFTIHTGALPAGRYLQQGFNPPLSFTIGPGWRAYFDDPDELYMEDVHQIAWGATRLENVVDPVSRAVVPAPEDLGAWFKKHPALDGVTLTSVTVAALPATLVEAQATRTTDVYASPDGNFRLVSGAKYRIYVVPMDGPNLVITTLGPTPGLFDAALPTIQAIIDSLRIAG